MKKDGNCLFRAIADQLEDDEESHNLYQNIAVEFLKQNKERVRKFIIQENGENLEDYISHTTHVFFWVTIG